MSKRAIILAGGMGTRLKPYTVSLPKPLVPIGTMPVIEIIIRHLANNGFDHITVTLSHMADIIKAFCGDGSKWRIKIDYSYEEKPLSTMGPLRLIDNLPENFLVMNGDVITDLDLLAFYNYHVNKNNLFTISSFTREHKMDYGILQIQDDHLIGFNEKPSYDYQVSMGIYMVNNKILDHIPKNTPYGFDALMADMILKNMRVDVRHHEGYWLDIGRPDDYEQACRDFDDKRINIWK